jgi:hypothetical protein
LASIREEHGEEDRFFGVQVWAVLPEEVHVFVFMSVYPNIFSRYYSCTTWQSKLLSGFYMSSCPVVSASRPPSLLNCYVSFLCPPIF